MEDNRITLDVRFVLLKSDENDIEQNKKRILENVRFSNLSKEKEDNIGRIHISNILVVVNTLFQYINGLRYS